MTDSKVKGQQDPKAEGQTDTGSPVKPAPAQDEQNASNSAGDARSDKEQDKRQENLTSVQPDDKDEDQYADSDKRYEPKRKTHRKPLKGSQLDETGEGSPVLKPNQFGRLVDADGRELSVLERLVMLEGDNPSYGSHI